MNIDEKGNGSNAHWWKRLKNPDTLRPYLRIADALGIPMPIIKNIAPRASSIQKQKFEEITFYKPYNDRINIIRARDVIAKYLAENNLSLGNYIKECDLLPLQKYTPPLQQINEKHYRKITEEDLYGSTRYTSKDMQNFWDNFPSTQNAPPIKNTLPIRNIPPARNTASIVRDNIWRSKTVAELRAQQSAPADVITQRNVVNESNPRQVAELLQYISQSESSAGIPRPKPLLKLESKSDIVSVPKLDVKPEVKPEVITEPVIESKSEPDPKPQPESNSELVPQDDDSDDPDYPDVLDLAHDTVSTIDSDVLRSDDENNSFDRSGYNSAICESDYDQPY